jgi:hypothetical protein
MEGACEQSEVGSGGQSQRNWNLPSASDHGIGLDRLAKGRIVIEPVAELVEVIGAHESIQAPGREGMAVLVVVIGEVARLAVANRA